MRLRILVLGFLALAACARTRPAMKPNYPFSSLHRIAVAEFTPEAPGAAASSAFARELLRRGYEVVRVPAGSRRELLSDARKDRAEVLLTGAVLRSVPERAYLVRLSETRVVRREVKSRNSQNRRVDPPEGPGRREGRAQDISGETTEEELEVRIVHPIEPIEVSGRSAAGLLTPAAEGSRLLFTEALVSMSAEMWDVSSGELVWSDSTRYESLDLETAHASCARALLGAWARR